MIELDKRKMFTGSTTICLHHLTFLFYSYRHWCLLAEWFSAQKTAFDRTISRAETLCEVFVCVVLWQIYWGYNRCHFFARRIRKPVPQLNPPPRGLRHKVHTISHIPQWYTFLFKIPTSTLWSASSPKSRQLLPVTHPPPFGALVAVW